MNPQDRDSQPDTRRIRPTIGPAQPERICVICQQTISSTDPTYTHDTCKQSWHRSPCFEDLVLHENEYDRPPDRCSYCRAPLTGPFPCRINLVIVRDESKLDRTQAFIGGPAFSEKPLAERRIETVTTEELMKRMGPAYLPEDRQCRYEDSFGVFTWDLFKFPEPGNTIVVAIPAKTAGNYHTRQHSRMAQDNHNESLAKGTDSSTQPDRSRGKFRQLFWDFVS